MTKEEQSDLKSFHDRVVQTAISFEHAKLAYDEAKRQYENYIHGLVYRKDNSK